MRRPRQGRSTIARRVGCKLAAGVAGILRCARRRAYVAAGVGARRPVAQRRRRHGAARVDPRVGCAPARQRPAAPVRREHLLSRAAHAGVFRSPDRPVADGRAADVGGLLAGARPQRRAHRRVCADRLDDGARRGPLDRQPGGRVAERIPRRVQRVHADPSSPDPGSPLRVLSAGAPGARSPARRRTACAMRSPWPAGTCCNR